MWLRRVVDLSSALSLLLHDPYSVCGNLNQFLLTITIVRPACPPPDTPGALFTKQSRPSPVARSRAPGRETNPILLGRRHRPGSRKCSQGSVVHIITCGFWTMLPATSQQTIVAKIETILGSWAVAGRPAGREEGPMEGRLPVMSMTYFVATICHLSLAKLGTFQLGAFKIKMLFK